jgi:hypothetical protein
MRHRYKRHRPKIPKSMAPFEKLLALQLDKKMAAVNETRTFITVFIRNKNLLLVPILSHTNPAYNGTRRFFRIKFNVRFPSLPRSSN